MDGDHRAYAWEEALPQGAWGRHEDVARWLLGHTPLARVMGAYEGDPRTMEPHRMASLFGLCVRAIVPFAIVDAILQSRLPASIGDIHTLSVASEEASTAPSCHGDWWVSGRRSTRTHERGCGWLRPIPERDVMRIITWHWANLVKKTIQARACVDGFRDDTWEHMVGHTVLPYHMEGDAVIVHSGPVFFVTKEPHSTVERIWKDAESMTRVPHPWYDDIRVHFSVSYDTYDDENGRAVKHVSDWSVIALVRGDRDFAAVLFS